MKTRSMFMTVLLMMVYNFTILSFNVSAQTPTWSGQVVDARTGKPLSNTKISGWAHGPVQTGADGTFTYPLDEKSWKSSRESHYDKLAYWSLQIQNPFDWRKIPGTGYWHTRLYRTYPGQVVVRLMPRQVYVKGRVLSAEDGKPLANVMVNMSRRKPGETFGVSGGSANYTDADGNFSYKPLSGFIKDDAGYPSERHEVPLEIKLRSGGSGLRTAPLMTAQELARHNLDYGPMWEHAVVIENIRYPISPDRIVTSIDEGIHTYVVIRHPAKDKPPHPNPITAEPRGLAGTQPDTPTTQPTEPPPTPPPSGTVSLTGEWDIYASNHLGKMTINQQGSRFTGTIFGDQLIEGTITGNTVTFTRKISAIQHYTGTLTLAPDGTATMTGAFTQNRSGPYTWTATKTTSSPKTTPEAPPATTPTPKPARFTVEAGKRNLSQGGSVTVPVSFHNVEGLANMNVNIHYDPAVVKPARNASRGNIIPQSLFEANVRDRGVIRLGFAQQTDIRGTGTLAQIPFEAVGRPGSRTALRIEVTTASTAAGSRVTPAQLIHGEITIVGADGRLPGDTSGTGELTALDAMNALKMSVGNLAVDMVADVDRDGSVTARDATQILQQVVRR